MPRFITQRIDDNNASKMLILYSIHICQMVKMHCSNRTKLHGYEWMIL